MATQTTPRYQVTGECVLARSPGSGFDLSTTKRVEGFTYYRGSVLPADVPADTIEHLLTCGLIAPFQDVTA